MKKSLLLIILFVSTAGMAQTPITLNQSDMATTGVVVHMGVDTLSSLVVTPAGPNQIWNYVLIQQDKQDSMLFLQPNLTPFGSMNPTSNSCYFQLPDTTYAYLITNPTSTSMVGMAQSRIIDGHNITASAHFSDYQTMMKFPTHYLDNFKDTSAFDIKLKYGYMFTTILVDSIRIKNKTWITDTIDAWGDIVTPLGTFPSLREKRIQISQDSIWAYALGSWTDVTSIIGIGMDTVLVYNWYANNMKYAIFQLVVDYATDTVKTASYMNATPTIGIAEINYNNFKLFVYPNPASDYLNIYNTLQGNNILEIYNDEGQKVKTVLMNETEKQINIQELSAGIYYLSITNINTKLTTSGKFTVTK